MRNQMIGNPSHDFSPHLRGKPGAHASREVQVSLAEVPNEDRFEVRKMIGPWQGLDGKVHDAAGKTFELEFCTVARWKDGEIVEENLFYDQVGFLRQVGLL